METAKSMTARPAPEEPLLLPPTDPLDPPSIQFSNEVRYAVVMYGGVSLCIYINGVAQELLELARATAPGEGGQALTPTPQLSPSAKIYRRLGQYLDSDSLDSTLLRHDSADVIRTRFVVDVLAGTSAGGLNSIFLAKALANNQDMKGLKELWMQEGDINRLLNDKVSNSSGFPAQAEPTSLLNSHRMYQKLLTALHGMDFPGDPEETKSSEKTPTPAGLQPSPLVDELDLYVTATDLRGLPIHLKLDNAVADEFRHRNVFPFRYSEDCSLNDFSAKFNPFLAYAGRCTSSIPPAFEPMRVNDIWPILEERTSYRGNLDEYKKEWARFYPDYAKTDETGDFWERDFGDGGFLDNKPFSYATRTLMRRQAERPVSRKLLYIEPTPEKLGCDTASARPKPDALGHSLAALIGLPRYETIREDIEAVIDRNRLLERIDQVTRLVDQDVAIAGAKAIQRQTRGEFEKTRLQEMIDRHGISYGIYHRLKVAEVTSELAALVSGIVGYPDRADECVAIRQIVESWRNRRYKENPSPGDESVAAETKFLLDFDISYRLRRLFFLSRKITFFYRFKTDSVEARERQRCLDEGLPDPLPAELAAVFESSENWELLREALRGEKERLAVPLRILRTAERALNGDSQLKSLLEGMNLKERLERCLKDPSYAESVIADNQDAFENVSRRIAEIYREILIAAAMECDEVLSDSADKTDEGKLVRKILRGYFDHFDHYDMAIFPVQYGTGAAESPHVDIIRVSPGDARNLCDDAGRRKLAGTEFFSFGAFFTDFWRENDMLWGRLDGAEVLVRNLLRNTPAETTLAKDSAFHDHPGLGTRNAPTVADLLVDDLHTAILRDHLTGAQREAVWKTMQKALPHLNRSNLHEEIQRFLDDSPQLDHTIRHLINFCKDDAQLLRYYKETYVVDRRLDRGQFLRIAGRATQIFGRMLEGISTGRGAMGQDQAAFFTRVASIFSGLVELSFPRTFVQILWRYWRSLLYLIGGLLLVTGFLAGQPTVQKGGLLILLVTGGIHITTMWLELWIGRSRRLRGATATILSLVVALLFALGAWKAYDLAIGLLRQWSPANRDAVSHSSPR